MDLMYCGDFDISLQELIECDLKSEIENADLMTELANGPLLSDDGFDDMDNLDHQLLDPYTLSYGLSSAASLMRPIPHGGGGSHRLIHGHAGISSGGNSYSNISFDEQYVMVSQSSFSQVILKFQTVLIPFHNSWNLNSIHLNLKPICIGNPSIYTSTTNDTNVS